MKGMQRLRIYSWMAALWLIIPFQVPAQLQAPVGEVTSNDIHRLMAAYHTTGLFNGNVLVVQDGKTLLKQSYGFSNVATRSMNTPETKFALYSITKAMTATLVLQFVDKRQLRLTDKLSRFYPSFPAADSITIEHLLTHTSGLYPYNNDFSMPTESEDAMIHFLTKRPLRFAPGSSWEYCNTGYYLLGFIIEKLSGLRYEDALEEFIFKPLQMNQSGSHFRELASPEKASGYQFLYADSGQVATLYADNELRSAGAVWSTTEDLYKFHKSLQSYQLISASLTQKAYTPFKSNYGYGWFIDSVAGKQIVGHDGGAAGFRTSLIRVPEDNLCIVLLANGENIDLTVIKKQLLLLLLGQAFESPVNVKIDKAQLVSMTGVYKFETGHSLYVNLVRDRLVAQISGQRPTLLLADSSQHFISAGLDGYLAFFPENDSMVFFRKGLQLSGARISPKWGITGTAVSNGWDGPDVSLTPDKLRPGFWMADSVVLKKGVIKFRYNNDWTFNYGASPENSSLVSNGEDIPVSAGNYKIELKLEDASHATFRLQAIDK